MKNNRKLTKKQRVVNYFLDAALEIATEEGVGNITIRNVSERAGYNSGTLYNYFTNRDELIAFAVIRYVALYLSDVSECITDIEKNPVKSYLSLWYKLCIHTFDHPQIFCYAYASTPQEMNNVQSNIAAYVEMFPDTFSEHFDSHILQAFSAPTHVEHDRSIIKPFVDMGLFTDEDAEEINYFGTTIYNGLLNKAINLKDMDSAGYTDCFMKYFVMFLRTKIDAEKFGPVAWEYPL